MLKRGGDSWVAIGGKWGRKVEMEWERDKEREGLRGFTRVRQKIEGGPAGSVMVERGRERCRDECVC
jgi:hypothetical protein